MVFAKEFEATETGSVSVFILPLAIRDEHQSWRLLRVSVVIKTATNGQTNSTANPLFDRVRQVSPGSGRMTRSSRGCRATTTATVARMGATIPAKDTPRSRAHRQRHPPSEIR